ncbi:MAG: hypothetical protein K2H03_10125, partial [Muribaculaceae bacterium]|nr:hypothetical protein [Muribaculaceae bacterium]
MKQLVTVAAIGLLALSACQSNDKSAQQQQQQQLHDATKEELVQAVAERDELLELLGDITTDVQEVKRLENVLSASNGMSETPDRRQQIQSDIAAIQQALQQRRERLAELEAKLEKSNTSNEKLRATIASLRKQIDDQTVQISTLTNNLAEAKSQVSQLTTVKDSLTTTVTNVSSELEETQAKNADMTNEMNTVYFVVATDKELKEHGIIQKKKVLLGDYDKSFFTVGDKRTLTTIPLRTKKKVEIMTPAPNGSYAITKDSDETWTLHIT